MKKIDWKKQAVKSLKIALAAAIAIAVAGELGLKYSATAGIITVLSIGNTKRETLKTAVERGLAFLCALLLAAGCFGVFGYTLPGFTVYLLLFALLCLCVGWGAAIAMDSVLITHFLGEQSMAPVFLLNEVLLFFIGTGMGILVNMHLHRKEADFRRLSDEVDSQIKGILHRMSLWLPREDKSEYGSGCFEKLDKALEEARLCAAANYNNSVLERNPRELDYIEMREKQSIILKGIYENIKSITFLPEQAKQVAELFGKIEEDYHRENTVEELLNSLGKLLEEMKQQELPASREEFEARAILFYILMQTESFLNLKRDYMLRNGFL
ncbi:MAG: aromatic acid exporter family protein [Lachnospiraceae bacterium]|nr:aromatic acid exporter family protein [Lachnospiraceae bacterium]